jgi:DNA-binding Lrp family transcriptional regulator
MTQPKAKIQGKFYALQNDEWVKACQELTPAQRDVLYYLRTLDPYGDRPLNLGVTEIARQLKLDKSTVSRALKALDQKGWIDLELIQVKAKILSQGKCCSDATALPPDNSVASEQLERSLRNEDDPDATSAIATQRARSLRNNQDSEPSNSEASNTSKTIKTYSDFIQTLSESERENFEKFIREEWKRLKGEEVVSLERFLAKPEDLKSWHERFLKSPVGKEAKKKALASERDWRNDPCFMEWIHEAFHRGYEWVHENEADREQRNAFYDWAFAVNAFEGVCL